MLYLNRVVSFAVVFNGNVKMGSTNYQFHTCESIFIGGTFAKSEGVH